MVPNGLGTALKPAFEPIVLARKPLSEPTIAGNVCRWGTGAINVDAGRVPIADDDPVNSATTFVRNGKRTAYGAFAADDTGERSAMRRDPAGRWPANLAHDGSPEVLAAFAAYGERRAAGNYPSDSVGTGNGTTYCSMKPQGALYEDTGTAARFFFCAKASAEDRLGSRHPTVKPIALMRWLVRLITPPGGLVLDPFAGSGTTGMACLAEGFRCVMIEREAQSVEDIRRRLVHVRGADTPLFAESDGDEQLRLIA